MEEQDLHNLFVYLQSTVLTVSFLFALVVLLPFHSDQASSSCSDTDCE